MKSESSDLSEIYAYIANIYLMMDDRSNAIIYFKKCLADIDRQINHYSTNRSFDSVDYNRIIDNLNIDKAQVLDHLKRRVLK